MSPDTMDLTPRPLIGQSLAVPVSDWLMVITILDSWSIPPAPAAGLMGPSELSVVARPAESADVRDALSGDRLHRASLPVPAFLTDTVNICQDKC